MNAEIVLEGFREHRRSLLWWSFGLIVFTVITLVFYPSIRDSSGLSDYSKDLPEAMRAMFVGGELDLTSPSGFLNSQIFAVMAPTLLAIFAVSTGASAIAGDEERGLLDQRLAQPVSRTSMVVQQFFWLLAGVAILTVVLLATVVLGGRPFDLKVDFMNLLAISVSTGLFGLLFGVMALAVGCVIPGKSRAVAVAAAVATLSWIIDGLAKSVSWLQPAQDFSPYHQAYGASPLLHGIPWGGWAVLVAITAALVAISIVGLNRRDIRQ